MMSNDLLSKHQKTLDKATNHVEIFGIFKRLIFSSNKHILRTYYVPGIVLRTEDRALNKKQTKTSVLMECTT